MQRDSDHREKMAICANVRLSKVTRTPIKVGVRTYVTYTNCWALKLIDMLIGHFE